jgi:hypothetical protein
MKHSSRRHILAAALAVASARAFSQEQPVPPPLRFPDEAPDRPLPNGKSQRDEILKSEHEQNLKDADQLIEMAKELKEQIVKDDTFVLSMSTLKKTDDIEKLVKKIRARLHH